MTTAASKHVISLSGQVADFENAAGSITSIDKNRLPLLRRMSVRRLLLAPNATREPHWHANANELGYCLRGSALITIVQNHGQQNMFVVGKGEMFFFPSGTIHSIHNTGDSEAEFILTFSHELPEDFGLSGSFDVMSDAVLGNTFNTNADALRRSNRIRHNDMAIFEVTEASQEPGIVTDNSLYKYGVESVAPATFSAAGSAHTAKSDAWPILSNLAMFSVRITDQGMREPHWHPETAELGYVVEGHGRMTILDPDGSSDTYEIHAGDTYFIPRAYPHHIENLGAETLHILIFFDQSIPGDIGYRAVANGFSPEVIACGLGVSSSSLPVFPKDEHDPLIIERINPLE
ncbi:cupin domain-containing protein [Phyllobacterium myrsinacearum]|uniref:Oxalate decarboxylase n=1 Tax=Phyllobacterium myrsinacearum TaxID=28101 RepID=A0A839EHF6_9HYPH|nr:cupin domain-containing protein [Phyllobacterium myrsinacearum]MBA8878322.1 oxalate decarboxylase [Phyllobacterium myrsinacearum]